MSQPKVAIAITTRDGAVRADVLQAALAASHFAPGSWVFNTAYRLSSAVSRNQAVTIALAHEASHLFFIDCDTMIQPEALKRLLLLDANVAAGCVPTTGKNAESFVHLNISCGGDSDNVTWHTHYFEGVKEARYAGTACMLIRCGVFGQIGFPWFRIPETYKAGKHVARSEDIDFCDRIHDHNLGPIKVDGAVRCGHLRQIDAADAMPAMEVHQWR